MRSTSSRIVNSSSSKGPLSRSVEARSSAADAVAPKIGVGALGASPVGRPIRASTQPVRRSTS